MCTVSWLLGTDSYQVLCNRDEKKLRVPATPPAIIRFKNLKVLAPQDPQGGGTWQATNSLGITIALLNGDTRVKKPFIRKSRGLPPNPLIRLGAIDQIKGQLEDIDLSVFLTFTLLTFAPGQFIQRLDWDGTARRFSKIWDAYGFASPPTSQCSIQAHDGYGSHSKH